MSVDILALDGHQLHVKAYAGKQLFCIVPATNNHWAFGGLHNATV